MPTPLIITRSDFAGRVELSSNMVDAKINNRILEAEDFDLRELMGDAFYWDFIAGFNSDGTQKNTATDFYKALYMGGNYAIKAVNYTFYGLKPVLVYYAAARLIKALDISLTPNGAMVKKNDFSDHAEPTIINAFANQYTNQGLAYWNMCAKYLDASNWIDKTSFPLWRQGCFEEDKPKTSPKVTAIGGRHDANYYNDVTLRRF